MQRVLSQRSTAIFQQLRVGFHQSGIPALRRLIRGTDGEADDSGDEAQAARRQCSTLRTRSAPIVGSIAVLASLDTIRDELAKESCHLRSCYDPACAN